MHRPALNACLLARQSQVTQRTCPLSPSSQDPEGESLRKAVEILRPLLRNPEQAAVAVQRVAAVTENFSGPMPHPRHLKGYEEIVPGSAREILDMAKAEQRHRHRMEWMEMVYPYLGLVAGS